MRRFWRAVTPILLSLLILALPAAGADRAERVVITLPESATSEGKWLILGDIVEIGGGPPELVAEAAAVNAGAAPGVGTSRQLTKGQIEVRIRQARLDLSLIEFRGATAVTVFGGGAAGGGSDSKGDGGVKAEAEIVVAARDLARGGEILTAADLVYEAKENHSASAVYNGGRLCLACAQRATLGPGRK